MKNIITFFLVVLSCLISAEIFCQNECTSKIRFDGKKVVFSEKEWKEKLTDEQFEVLRKASDEKPFANDYYVLEKKGIYHCAGCNLALFSSKTKFDGKTGSPCFYAPICPQNLAYRQKRVWLRSRTQVLCNRCEGYLGQMLDDNKQPTGKRYSINSLALIFEPR